MSQEQLKVNDLVQILIPPGSLYSGHHKSRVEDVGEETITLALPFKAGQVIPIHVGERLMFYKATENGVWVYQVMVQSRRTSPLPVLEVTKPFRADKVQRRNFYRFPITIKVRYAKQDKEKEPLEWPWHSALIRNISGGGAGLAAKEDLAVGTELLLEIPLGKDVIITQGIVRRVSHEGDHKNPVYGIGVEFHKLTKGDQDKIIHFIFARQREMRSQGKD